MTDLFVSPESMEDVVNWGLDQVSDDVRTTIFNTCDGLTTVHCVKIHELYGLGVGHEFQDYYSNDLSGPLPNAANTSNVLTAATEKEEIVVGLNLDPEVRADTFVMPVETPLKTKIRECDSGHRRWSGHQEYGLGILSSRPLILGAA